jgi:hypothetical protein
MPALYKALVVVLVCLGSVADAQKLSLRSEDAAARVFGPRWRQLARDSGMIFSGTVLEIRSVRAGEQKQIPIIKIKFRLERAIAGVYARQEIRIREWAGAWSEHRLHVGERVLLLLYPESRLGLTSPVAGSLGQVTLSNKNTVVRPAFVADNGSGSQLHTGTESETRAPITLDQLEQAIRQARDSQRSSVSRGRTIAEEE